MKCTSAVSVVVAVAVVVVVELNSKAMQSVVLAAN